MGNSRGCRPRRPHDLDLEDRRDRPTATQLTSGLCVPEQQAPSRHQWSQAARLVVRHTRSGDERDWKVGGLPQSVKKCENTVHRKRGVDGQLGPARSPGLPARRLVPKEGTRGAAKGRGQTAGWCECPLSRRGQSIRRTGRRGGRRGAFIRERIKSKDRRRANVVRWGHGSHAVGREGQSGWPTGKRLFLLRQGSDRDTEDAVRLPWLRVRP